MLVRPAPGHPRRTHKCDVRAGVRCLDARIVWNLFYSPPGV